MAREGDAEGGFTIKPRGRLQLDANSVSRPIGLDDPTLGLRANVRRAFLGVDGKVTGGLGYRIEADFASGKPLFTDLWLTYEAGPVTFILGHDRMTTLEDLTSDLDTSFLERAAFVAAFGFERRLGFSATYAAGDVLASAGIYSDDLQTLDSAALDDSYAFDGRLAYAPEIDGTRWHLAASVHHRELDATPRYRARPAARTTDVRFVDTGRLNAEAETGYGVEFAMLRGPVHVAAEAYWQRAERPGLSDPTFFGAYGEIGFIFAGGGERTYKDGSFAKITAPNGIDKGGPGTWQINVRYDRLDLEDLDIRGGTQRTAGASLVWVPVDHVKLMANYVHVMVEDSPVLAGSRDDYGVDVVGLRAQVSF